MKFAICNETWQNVPFSDTCAAIAEAGYEAVEIAPFTLREDPWQLTLSAARELGNMAARAGLEVVGLHWLLVKPDGLHLTSPDAETRRRTVEFGRHLVRLSAAMGGRVLVWGSPKQRSVEPDWDRADAVKRAADVVREIAGEAQQHGQTIAMEPLARRLTNFLNTADETSDFIKLVDHPAVKLHLDVMAMSDEGAPVTDIMRGHLGHTVHFHANDANQRGPGFGEVDFRPLLKTLLEERYDGFVSVEVFDYSPDPDTIAVQSLKYLKKCLAEVKGKDYFA